MFWVQFSRMAALALLCLAFMGAQMPALADPGARGMLLRYLDERRSMAAQGGSTTESAGGGDCQSRKIMAGGIQRTYLLHVPAGYAGQQAIPLVLVFHGGFGDGDRIMQVTQFNPLADAHGFMVAYPNGINRHWNDGRGDGVAEGQKPDDVGFVRSLIASLSAEFNIDPRRIYATGISNGGIFSHRLGAELSDKIAAIAPVAGSIGEGLAATFAPAQPVSVLQIHGTADRGVAFNGGPIVGGKIKGATLSVSQTLRRWVAADGCRPSPQRSDLPNLDSRDGASATVYLYSGGKAGSEVELIEVRNGGHNWPGMSPQQRGLLTDNICEDFSASQKIWEFFSTHPKMAISIR